ncbi:MAG: thioredoxin domain-containing protein, partial [Kiritimatiellae bacterium]|nr:thioredoxin domain-containing protein [Kiritimatiellia bacterium]
MTHFKTRRACLKSMAAFAVAPLSTYAVPSSLSGALPTPYREVRFRAEDAHAALAFFSYTCSVCRTYHAGLVRWGATLPAPWAFEMIPVTTATAGDVGATMVRHAIQRFAPTALPAFDQAVYELVQDRGLSMSDVNTWRRAARTAGVANLDKLIRQDNHESVWTAASRLTAYQIAVTPSLAVGGRYVITPDDTHMAFLEPSNTFKGCFPGRLG